MKCHEFFECDQRECTMFNDEETRNCWEIEPTSTSCTKMLPKSATKENKIFHCHNCEKYYTLSFHSRQIVPGQADLKAGLCQITGFF